MAPRVVSLVPSATDTVVALGAADCLVAISADCDQPRGLAAPLPVATRPVVPPAAAAGDPRSADAAVRDRLESGGSLYELDADLVALLDPDLLLSQDGCAVCALPSSEVVALLTKAGATCDVLSIDPLDLDSVLRSFAEIGEALGIGAAGAELAASCRQRLDALTPPAGARPRVAVLDWTDPVFLAGNWVPDLVRAAGGVPVLVGTEEVPRRSTETSLDALLASAPDVVVVAPCGLDLAAASSCAESLASSLPAACAVVAFDGRLWFSRPGPSLVEGAEMLAAWLSAERPAPGSGAAGGSRLITEGARRG